MVKQTIKIFCRIKPTKQVTGLYEVNEEETQQPIVSFTVPKDLSSGFINNKKENYKFSFDHVFEQQAKQDEVFEKVAQPVIENVLSGFNGTIFAYGQTGSGKTFSITGGPERYADRGIIPRSLSHIFSKLISNADHVFTIHISYLEIYNESGYDLLDPKHEVTKLEDLPKILLLEDNDGNIHLKNLSIHQANNEEEALNLLFLGDTNRMISETPMNQASTRSHCIFTVHIMVRESDSATIRRSKLHLVDLAGSERVSKTGVAGTILKEAKYINLSLHFLEQVIIALSEKSRSHIPYRNSMMTSVLRDSLGGNCMTTMIATCSVEKKNIDESISTCRFAERVAMIKNDAILNEELDPKLLIAKLKREIQQLKDELSLATGDQYESELSEEEKERLRSLVTCYIQDKDEEALLSVNADMRKINFCFSLLKTHCLNNTQAPRSSPITTNQTEIEATNEKTDPDRQPDTSYLANKSEVTKLKELIMQRDNEINILVSMLKKEKQRGEQLLQHPPLSLPHSQLHQQEQQQQLQRENPIVSGAMGRQTHSSPNMKSSVERGNNSSMANSSKLKSEDSERDITRRTAPDWSSSMSLGRKEAYEIFKRDYKDNEVIEENRKGLKARYKDAKQLGEKVNASREAINSVKSKLEKLRSYRSSPAYDQSNRSQESDQQEKELRSTLDIEKTKYKEAFNKLKLLKTEIEHIQHLLERLKVKMHKDFEIWWIEEASKLAQKEEISHGGVKSAWRTPPITPVQSELKNMTHSEPTKVSDEKRQSLSNSLSFDKSNYSRSDSLSSQHLNNSVRRDTNLSNSGRESQTSLSSRNRQSPTVRLTGDEKTDQDILAFMKAREELIKKTRR